MSDHTLSFVNRNELLRLKPDSIVCFKADGNYTQIVLRNGSKYTVCVNLSSVAAALAKHYSAGDCRFARVGKSHIVNLELVQHLHLQRQRVILGDGAGQNFAIQASRDAIRALKALLMPRAGDYINAEPKRAGKDVAGG